jgi:hypothetical protein
MALINLLIIWVIAVDDRGFILPGSIFLVLFLRIILPLVLRESFFFFNIFFTVSRAWGIVLSTSAVTSPGVILWVRAE